MENNKSMTASTAVNNSKRIVWVDVMKGLMIFAIVLGHSFAGESRGDNMLKLYLTSFDVPAFFFVSGFLYKHKREPFGTYVIKKIKGLMIPYYIFSVISILIFMIFGSLASDGLGVAVKSTNLLPNICGMLYGNGSTGYMKWNLPLWFIPCLFAILLLFYGINELALAAKKRSKAVWVGLFVVCLVLAFLNYYVFNIRKLPFGFETVVCVLPFFMAGYGLRRNNIIEKLQSQSRIVLGIVFLIVGAVLACVNGACPDYPSSYYGNMLLFYISSFASVAGFTMLLQSASNKLLSYVGQNTLPILLMHKFPIVFLQMIFVGVMSKNNFIGVLIAIVIAAASCVMSLVAGEIIKRIAPFALGTVRPKSVKKK